ncbi:MAG: LysR family transcriptional regulator [Plesiomonas sp.]|uniref:LysR family transcriptional regulator n=1 Tax=Plesiomonas sp. TaxID=2486279 RepID=UPI003F36241D
MRLKIEDMVLFAKVAETLNFSHAADELGIPLSTLSRRIALFEKELQIPLFERSTRQVCLTYEGKNILVYCCDIINKKNELEGYITGSYYKYSGDLTVVASYSTISFLIRNFIQAFSEKYPDINVIFKTMIDTTDDIGGDILLTGRLPKNDNLMITRISTVKKRFFASPAYIAQYGEPLTLQELSTHNVLLVKNAFYPELSDYYTQLEMTGTLKKNTNTYSDISHALDIALNGKGILWAPVAMVKRRVKPEALKILFDEKSIIDVFGYAIYKQRFVQPNKIRCFIDELKIFVQIFDAGSHRE